MFFTSKQRKIESQLTQYRQQVSLCVAGFQESIGLYCLNNDRDELRQGFLRVHKTESCADDIRREIEVMMYSKSIFPESRGDIMGLLESLDKVPNQVESALQMLLTHHMEIPAEFHSSVEQIVTICRRCVETLLNAVDKLFTDFTNATVAIGNVDELESAVDHLEAELIDKIFQSTNLDGVTKLMLRDLVVKISSISDRAENAGDRIRIIVAKRNV
jgi:uncharacterized protein